METTEKIRIIKAYSVESFESELLAYVKGWERKNSTCNIQFQPLQVDGKPIYMALVEVRA